MSVVEAVEAVEVEAVEDMILAQRLVAMVGTLAPPLRVLLGVVLRKAGGASHHGGASRHGGEREAMRLDTMTQLMETALQAITMGISALLRKVVVAGGASLHGGEGQATRLGEEVMETKL
mmetsp:Transcript_20348/g.29444  ORF Transcript_20348/g.29444 Transcript_20348/m.29444 type:complete len:120 (+) Transcript_20348:530-889(+)